MDFDSIFNLSNDHAEPEIQDHIEEAPETVAAEAPVEEVEATPANEPVEQEVDQHPVPLATFLDMRDKMKERKAEAETLRRQLDEINRQKAESNRPSMPDPSTDPHGFASLYQQQIANQMFEQKLQIYGDMAIQRHGDDAVRNAAAWAQSRIETDPHFAQSFRSAANPVQFIIEQQQQAETLHLMQSDPVAYARKIAEEQGWLAPPTAAEVTTSVATQPPAKKPTTLTDVPSARASKAPVKSEKDSLDAVFNSR